MNATDDEVSKLYHVANDHEADTLDRLRRKAGLTWEHYGCWTNRAESSACERCGTPFADLPADDVDGAPAGGEDR